MEKFCYCSLIEFLRASVSGLFCNFYSARSQTEMKTIERFHCQIKLPKWNTTFSTHVGEKFFQYSLAPKQSFVFGAGYTIMLKLLSYNLYESLDQSQYLNLSDTITLLWQKYVSMANPGIVFLNNSFIVVSVVYIFKIKLPMTGFDFP